MLMEIVNKNYDKLNAIDVTILTYVTQHSDEVTKMGIEALAKTCYTSKSTVLRLVQKLGFSGFSDFKSYLKWERSNPTASGDYQDRLDTVQWDIAQTCRTARSSTDMVAIARAIRTSRTVVLFGTGEAQRYCAREFLRSFMELGVYLFYTGALDELKMLVRTLGPEDLVIFISLSGSMGSLAEVMRLIKVRGVRTASITNLTTNELAERVRLQRLCGVHQAGNALWCRALGVRKLLCGARGDLRSLPPAGSRGPSRGGRGRALTARLEPFPAVWESGPDGRSASLPPPSHSAAARGTCIVERG